MVTLQRAITLYSRLCMGEKLNAQERAELDEYASRFKPKDEEESCI